MYSTHKINFCFAIKFGLTDILRLILRPQCCCLLQILQGPNLSVVPSRSPESLRCKHKTCLPWLLLWLCALPCPQSLRRMATAVAALQVSRAVCQRGPRRARDRAARPGFPNATPLPLALGGSQLSPAARLGRCVTFSPPSLGGVVAAQTGRLPPPAPVNPTPRGGLTLGFGRGLSPPR